MPTTLTAAQKAALRKDAALLQAADGDLVDLLDGFQDQLDALPIDATVLTASIADGQVTSAKLAADAAAAIAVVGWANEAAETSNYIEIDLQLYDLAGDPLAEQCYLGIYVCDTDDPTDMSATAIIAAGAGAEGDIVDGSGTSLVYCLTDATGLLSLRVTETAADHRYLFATAMIGSPPLDCRDRRDLTFA